MSDMTAMVHGRPEGTAGELYDKLTSSRECQIMKDAVTIVTDAAGESHGLIGAVTTQGIDCMVVQFKKWQGEEVFIQKAVSIDALGEVMADLDEEQVLEECVKFIAVLVRENGLNLNVEDNG